MKKLLLLCSILLSISYLKASVAPGENLLEVPVKEGTAGPETVSERLATGVGETDLPEPVIPIKILRAKAHADVGALLILIDEGEVHNLVAESRERVPGRSVIAGKD